MAGASRIATLGAAVLAGAALAACSQPAWRNPATSKGSSALPPDIARIAAEAGRVRSTRTDHLTPADLPGPPDWAAPLIGKPLRASFPQDGACMGNTDGVKLRYENGADGARVAGWGWDPARKAAVPRVVLVDPYWIIRGAGETGARRRDVPRVVSQITSETTGWEAITPLNVGGLNAYGVLADGRTICKLGHVDL